MSDVIVVVGGSLQNVVVSLAEQSVLPQGELIARDKLSATRRTPETVNMVDPAARAHHKVVLAETLAAFGTLGAEQSGNYNIL